MRVQDQQAAQLQSVLKHRELDLQRREDDLHEMMKDLRDHLKQISLQRDVSTFTCIYTYIYYVCLCMCYNYLHACLVIVTHFCMYICMYVYGV